MQRAGNWRWKVGHRPSRLCIDPAQGYVPEISGNRMMVSVRLMRQMDDGHLQASADDATFELTLCA